MPVETHLNSTNIFFSLVRNRFHGHRALNPSYSHSWVMALLGVQGLDICVLVIHDQAISICGTHVHISREKSLGCSIFDVQSEYGVAGFPVVSRGTFT